MFNRELAVTVSYFKLLRPIINKKTDADLSKADHFRQAFQAQNNSQLAS